MKTPATEDFPEIEWQHKALMEKDVDERSETWEMSGMGTDGRCYSAIGYFTCDELQTITDIELED